MPCREADSREGSVVAAPVSTVLGKQKRVMDAMAAPERNAVLVVLQYSLERWCVLNVPIVVGIEAYEEERGRRRFGSLIWPLGEVAVEFTTGVGLVHGNRLDPPHFYQATSAADANEGAGFPLRRSAMIFAK